MIHLLLSGSLCSSLLGGSLLSLLVLVLLLNGPVKDVVVLESFPDKEITEELSKVRVVGLVIESERTAVVEVDGKLVGEATAENFGRCGHLLLHNSVVLLLLGSSLETLPGELATKEVHEYVSQRFHIISTRLLDSQMSVDRSITSGTSQILVLSVRDMEVRLWVAILLGKTKVNDIYLVTALADSHEKVVGLDVAMNKVSRVDVLDTRDLHSKKEFNSQLICLRMACPTGLPRILVIGRGRRVPDARHAEEEKPTNWSASRRTVLSENLLLQKLKRSSREGPRRSMTIAL